MVRSRFASHHGDDIMEVGECVGEAALALIFTDGGGDVCFDVVPSVGYEHFGHRLAFGVVKVGETQQGAENGVVGVLLRIECQQVIHAVMLQEQVDIDEVFAAAASFDGVDLHGGNVFWRSQCHSFKADRIVNPRVAAVIHDVNHHAVHDELQDAAGTIAEAIGTQLFQHGQDVILGYGEFPEEIKVYRLTMAILQCQRCASHKAHPQHFGLCGKPFQEFQGVGKDCLKV